MREIVLLIDYKGQFGSKSDSKYYRSGMDLDLLEKYFSARNYTLNIMNFSDVEFNNVNWTDKIILYTSQEDPGLYYKDYIEDVIYGLELAGAHVIPKYQYLRANSNKVFMQMLRAQKKFPIDTGIISHHYGTLEEYQRFKSKNDDTIVIKSATGAMSQGVYWGRTSKEIKTNIKKVSKLSINKDDIKDIFRRFKYKGYVKNSKHRRKFIVQNFIENLANDWKVLVFGDKFFLEYRAIRDNDFRASGSQRFKLNDDIPVPIPDGIFAFAENVRDALNTPHLSIDIGFNGNKFYLFEFQALYFSSYAHRKSKGFYHREQDEFIKIESQLPLEKLYADSTCEFVEKGFTY